jgi:hypothetical protein
MPIAIRLATNVSAQRLRDLVVENLEELLGEGSRPWDAMPPLDPRCVGAVDAQNNLTLVSFDPVDPKQALATGLRCMDELGSDLAARLVNPYRRPSHLLVLASEPPPGAGVLASSGLLSWATFRVLSVNGEFGLLVESGLSGKREGLTAVVPEDRGPAEDERRFQAL